MERSLTTVIYRKTGTEEKHPTKLDNTNSENTHSSDGAAVLCIAERYRGVLTL